ncbi:MAG: 2,3-bisphosphoglycerate-independent phosphoglycerate mutase [Flavobacteriales bacterium]|nr:2,3-bisphosphoglycerate-independent phosphoglycerate mutase [Flavobacteriales bacterium]MCB9364527.1 2,3-bisphosphoglycerate-independent phosphoglycerate mutase [Flavobacteriales bacterium]
MNSKKVALLILDGWGCGNKTKSDAIYNANTPFYDSCLQQYPNSYLKTFGEYVGLPEGQMGNSEVGHLNIGAGRVVYQDFAKINKAVKEKTIDTNPTLVAALKHAEQSKVNVHFIGLVSDGGIHSHQEHLYRLCEIANNYNVKGFVHAFTDGRDCDPKSGLGFLKELEKRVENTNCNVASVVGRYYAMDRDNRWERIRFAYDLMVNGTGEHSTNLIESIEKSYAENVTDEFIKPIVKVDENNSPMATIQPNDVVICFNFRTDRCREITISLTQKDIHEQNMHTLPLYYVTMTNYDKTFKNIHVIYDKDNLANTLGEVLEHNNKTQIRIAETEKYPHVTFFFSGGREKPFKGEQRILVNSPKVATYDLQPEMSAEEVTTSIIDAIHKNDTDFICLNFANPDMVGHTGVYAAIVKAVEKIDNCAQRVVEAGLKNDYSFIIIADHGNADFAINEDGTPNTAHSTNLVPCILIDKDYKTLKDGKLGDIAPTVLKIMGIHAPNEMDGVSLV